jgi:hypothetical protein
VSESLCTACGHHIDPSARLCPYCGADPRTGEKVLDTQAMLQEVFRPREVSTSETVIEYARQRQGIVIGVSVVIIFLALALLHGFVTARNEQTVSAAPAVPLTEITDLSNQAGADKPLPIPEFDFQHDGRPQKMQTFIVEAGAVTPPEVLAAEQAAQQPAQQAKQPAVGPQRPPAQ